MRKKKLLLIAVSYLLLLTIFHSPIGIRFNLQIVKPVGASPDVIIVPTNYTTIQEAINAAKPGDTILAMAETYYEHVVVNKTVSLIGENPVITIIDGSGTGTVVDIKASNVTIKGFTIQNGGTNMSDCGIYVRNHNGKISNSSIRNNYNGIWLMGFNSSNIVGNTISNNTYAIQISYYSSGNIIVSNTIANNSYGAWIPSSSATSNTFHHNNFMNNTTTQASDFGSGTIWDNGYPSGGNYWSDYLGVDEKSGPYQNITGISDEIGDTPHTISPFGTDYYPLMNPFIDEENPVANAGPDQSIFQGMTVTFDGSGSSDDGGIESYVWDFTDDATPKTLTGVHPTYRFKNVGNFTATLNVTDYFGKWSTDMMWVNVSADSTKPTISNLFQEPTLPDPNENVTIKVDVTDQQSGVLNVTISYRIDSGSWTNVSMSKFPGNNTWGGQIPGFPNGTEVQYKIIAYDNAENPTVDDNGGQYYVYTVIPEFPATIFLLLFIIFTLVAAVLKKNKKETSGS